MATRFAATSTLTSVIRAGLADTMCRISSDRDVRANPTPTAISAWNWCLVACFFPRISKVIRRLAAVLAMVLSSKLVARVHEQDWLAVTDDIAIALLADAVNGTSEDVLTQSFMAGNDLLLTMAPPDWKGGLDYLGILTNLAESDPAAMKRLDESCHRVLRLKDRMGLLDAF